jgi:hypothetical protein
MKKSKMFCIAEISARMRVFMRYLLVIFAPVALADTPASDLPAWQRFIGGIDIYTTAAISAVSFVVMVVLWKSKITSPAAIWATRLVAFIIILFNVIIWFAQA